MRISLTNFIVAAMLSWTVLVQAASAAPKAGNQAPQFKILSTNGSQFSLDSLKGKVVILDFFATWCRPCKISIPHLVEMNRKYGKQGLQILGVSVDESGEKVVNSFITEKGITYPVAFATDTMLSEYAVRGVPLMYLIDKNGRVTDIFRGYNDDIVKLIEERVKKLLKEK